MKKTVLFCVLTLFGLTTMAQVNYSIEHKIEQIESDYIQAWSKVDKVDGYRIQIMAVSGTNSRSRAESTCGAFKSSFPGVSAYITYSEPYFKVRVGNYTTRLEAYKDLQRIQLTFPNAYIVPDQVFFKN